jgi:hypothetical protein
MEEVSVKEYARRKGCSDTQIKKLRVAVPPVLPESCFGIHPNNGRPLVKVAEADKWWSKHYGTGEQIKPDKPKEKPKRGSAKNPITIIINDSDLNDDDTEIADPETIAEMLTVNSDDNKFTLERKKLIADLEAKKLKLGRDRGNLVEKSKVYSDLFAFGQEIRTMLMAIPDRVLDNVLAATTRHDAHSILTEELASCLEHLSRGSDVIK